MKILIVSQYFWPENFRINEIARSLLAKGHDVNVLTAKPNYPQGYFFTGYTGWGCMKENYYGININRIPIIARGSGSVRLALNYLSFVLSGLFFSPWILRKVKYDVIYVYAPSPILQAFPALFLGWLKSCPVVINVQDLWPESLSSTGYVKNRIVLKLVKSLVRFIYRRADLLLIQSLAFYSPVRELALTTPVKYYPNSVDNIFVEQSHDLLPSSVNLGEKFNVMFAGNLGSAQAVSVIVEAAYLLKQYPEIPFVVLGDGSSYAWMKTQVKERGLKNIHLLGRFTLETMPAFMKHASALLVTLADRPAFVATVPNKIQAYLAAGRPIIACLNGEGARLVLEAKAGLATPAENANALADTILHLYSQSPEERQKMGDNGRSYYNKHFDHNRLIDRLVVLLQAVSIVRNGD